MTKAQQKERAEAIERLREVMPPGTTVYTILRHVSQSGMMRHISVKTELEGLHDWNVALATESRLAPQEGIKVTGAGMDMGFALVYHLSRVLYPNGWECIAQDLPENERGRLCPSNDHSNREHLTHHKDGGYALRQRWI
jgi:hypothetical protein